MSSVNISGNQFTAAHVGIQVTNTHLLDPLERLRPAERASYKTRHGVEEGDQLHGCMQDTRVQIIADLEAWARDETAPKVYWLNGHLGTGKTSIAHTLSERLDMHQMLGASFFCSRSALRDATRIIPTTATMLALSNPKIRSAICEILTGDPDVANLNSLPHQFCSLIANPIKDVIDKDVKIYKVIIIDALDECSSQQLVVALIKAILNGIADIPLKFFIVTRPEGWITSAFRRIYRPSLVQEFTLHDVAKSDVQRDIQTYLRSALSEIVNACGYSQHDSPWPPEQELMALLKQSDGLFIYAATAIRYIGVWGVDFRWRLREIVRPGRVSALRAGTIDRLYLMIMDRAFDKLEGSERTLRREVLASVVLVQTPLSTPGIASVLDMAKDQIETGLSPFHSVIHVSFGEQISIFHASFREFIVDPARCGDGHHVDPGEGHEMLTVKCLQLLNRSLRRNICNLPEDTIGALAHKIPDLSVIPEALRYSCLHWVSHLAEGRCLADGSVVLEHLRTFTDEHLLHWFECLSVIGELETGLKSLGKANETLSKSANTHTKYRSIALLLKDARRCLQMGFDAIKHHCLNAYHPVLMWLPKKSLMREKYGRSLGSVPRVLTGLGESWGPTEQVMYHPKWVDSVGFSPDGTRVVSGSEDKLIRIWNAATGEMELALEGHYGSVTSVAFSSDGTRVASGSDDTTVCIWSAGTGDIEHVFQGHAGVVSSVGFSCNGKHVVSGSADKAVRIWNVGKGDIECLLEGHSDAVSSVAFSPDETRVVSGSDDTTLRIWNVVTGETEHVLNGHSDEVRSVVYSHNGTRVVSASYETFCVWNAATGEIENVLNHWSSGRIMSATLSADGARVVYSTRNSLVRIWNALTGEIERVLEGHSYVVSSVAFSPDGTRVVSGSRDNSLRIWNAVPGEIQRVVEGHSDRVSSVAFSWDGTRVVSGSCDNLVRIWNVVAGEIERVLEGHSHWVSSVAFSPDGTRVVSGSADRSVRIWTATSGAIERVLDGHSNWVSSVAFSHDGTRVVSGSCDKSVRIWNTATGEMECVLDGHSNWVRSVAFSHDGTRVISGSCDNSVRIWNAATGEIESVLEGHSHEVTSVAFSRDGICVVSSLWDKSVHVLDPVTHESISLPCHESFQFHDGSSVTHILPGRFRLLASDQRGVVLSLDRKWILTDWPRGACWIPPEFRDYWEIAVDGAKVCLGCSSGRVVIVHLMLPREPYL